MLPNEIPVDVSALLSTKIREVVVKLPVASKQTVSIVIPPQAPREREPTLKSLAIDVPLTFTFPEKPITGPPSRTEPDVISTSTQTEVLEILIPLHIPPSVKVTVPISVPPTVISSVMLVAEAAGTVASIAARTKAKIRRLLFRMQFSSYP